jgi:hypothetical protein
MRDRNATGRPAGRRLVMHALTAGSLRGLCLVWMICTVGNILYAFKSIRFKYEMNYVTH